MSVLYTAYTTARLLKASVCLGLCGLFFSGCALEPGTPGTDEVPAGEAKQELLPGDVPCSVDGVWGYTCHISGPGAEDPGGSGVNPGIGGDKLCYKCRTGCTKLTGTARATCLTRCEDTAC